LLVVAAVIATSTALYVPWIEEGLLGTAPGAGCNSPRFSSKAQLFLAPRSTVRFRQWDCRHLPIDAGVGV
jgi:hypothetical protein